VESCTWIPAHRERERERERERLSGVPKGHEIAAPLRVLSKWGNLSLEGRIAVIVEPADTKQANLLIISDLHLGEDLRPDAEEERERLAEVENDLVAFLEYYIWRRLDDRPWRLVINGDMVDFLSICLMPAEVDLIL